MNHSLQSGLVDRIGILAEQMTESRERFLADLIRIRSYTGRSGRRSSGHLKNCTPSAAMRCGRIPPATRWAASAAGRG